MGVGRCAASFLLWLTICEILGFDIGYIRLAGRWRTLAAMKLYLQYSWRGSGRIKWGWKFVQRVDSEKKRMLFSMEEVGVTGGILSWRKGWRQ